MRILVVEDEVLVALHLQRMLKRLGNEVVGPASSAKEALALVENGGLDAAILDINLGSDRTSFPVAELLQDNDVPFAFLSAYRDRKLPDRFAAVPRFVKPVQEADLREMIGQLMV